MLSVGCCFFKFRYGKFNFPVFASIFRYMPVFTGKCHRHGKYSYLPAFCQPWEKDCTDRKTDGMKDGQMHTQTDEGHFYSPPLPMSGENE